MIYNKIKYFLFYYYKYLNQGSPFSKRFTGYSDSFAAPAGFNDPIFAGSVDIIFSTGITQQVFDGLSSALKCTHYMEANNLYSLSPNEDVTVLNLRRKLFILENT